MNKRWYDLDPTVSMAVSLLHNAALHHREKTVTYMKLRLQENYPYALACRQKEPAGFLAMLQKRKTLDNSAWEMIETLRFVPEEDRKQLAVEMIRCIYCLENEDAADLPLNPLASLEAAI